MSKRFYETLANLATANLVRRWEHNSGRNTYAEYEMGQQVHVLRAEYDKLRIQLDAAQQLIADYEWPPGTAAPQRQP